ncbi:MAG: nitroreductase/quinone reductase family protein [Actinomycetota bacterium]
MPLPHTVARFNRRVTDRFVQPLVRRLPGFAVVHHVGRRSGRAHRTPVYVFGDGIDLLVVLTYGTRADWLRNALAGPAGIERSGSIAPIERIEVLRRDDVRHALPPVVTFALRLLTIRDVARLSTSDRAGSVSRVP